jgi:hypothetical protein
VWASRSGTERDALRMLSGMDVDAAEAAVLLQGRTDVPLGLEELVTNPYHAATCTYGQPEHVSFSTVDRACFPGEGADWQPLVGTIADLTEHQDGRRVEALLTDVLEAAGRAGDTLLSQDEALRASATYPLVRPPQLNAWTLESLGLASAALRGEEAWPIVSVDLADGSPGPETRPLRVHLPGHPQQDHRAARPGPKTGRSSPPPAPAPLAPPRSTATSSGPTAATSWRSRCATTPARSEPRSRPTSRIR